jgi:nucleoside-diphosphate-sugar epimerase
MTSPQTTIPKGSWVLVTGATGNVATQVAKQFLERGYKVRGTVRDFAKASWLVTDVFKAYADRGDFELIVVPDLAADHAFDDAVKGVSAIAHVASVVTFSPDPEEVIPQTVKGATGILEAALNEPSVREFVYTSSIVAATLVTPGNTTHVDDSTYNETAIELAWSKAAPEAVRGAIVYSASKAEAEKAVWDFVRQRKPHFTVNSVGPSHILGEQLHRSHLQSNGAWLKMLVDGDLSDLQNYNTCKIPIPLHRYIPRYP